MRRFDLAWVAAIGMGVAVIAAEAKAAAPAESFDYFRNSWNVVGLKDYNFGTRITPENELLLAGGASADQLWSRRHAA